MSDHLDLFDRREDDTGSLDLAELRAALARTAAKPDAAGTPGPDGDAAAAAGPEHSVRPAAPPPRPTPRREQRGRREALARRRRRRRRHTLAAVLVLAFMVAGIAVGVVIWRTNAAKVPDFSGQPGPQTIVRVVSGDTRDDIAASLLAAGVVASTKAFVDETVNDGDVARLKPGYYRVSTALSARAAADELANTANRVGQLRIVPGRRLADISFTPTGQPTRTVEGYLSAIAKSACVPINGRQTCWGVKDLEQAERTMDPVQLGVPDWAVDGVRTAPDPDNRLEGLIVPGDYDIAPRSTPEQALEKVIRGSAAAWSTSGVVAAAKDIGITPYQAAIIASLVEREGTAPIMTKVARVLYNRMQIRMKLQLDSTVDYAVHKSQLATTATDRQNPSPYNTYAHSGLPPTPIASPGPAAVAAALAPISGQWLYFVKVDTGGNFCFSVTFAEHEKCVAQARKNGVFG